MTNEQYHNAMKALQKANVEITSKGCFTVDAAGKRIKANHVAAILAGFDIEVADFMAEFRERQQAALLQTADAQANYYTQEYSSIVLDSMLLFNMLPFGGPVESFFSRFKYCRNPIDGSCILLVNTEGNEWGAIPLSMSAKADEQRLISFCGSALPSVGSRYKNLYEELTAKTVGILHNATKVFREADENPADTTVEYLKNKLPHSLLSATKVLMLCKREEIQIAENQYKTVYYPRTANLIKGESNYSVFRHLVEDSGQLMSVQSMLSPVPKIISNDPNEPAFKYIDLESITEDGPCPAWDEYFSRYSEDEAKVFRAFIWSIFYEKNRGRQLLYIYDKDGFSGKSVVMNAIASVLGDERVAAIQKDSLSNQFGLAKVYDKRLIIIGDNKNQNLIRSEKMHMLLGADRADIELKGRNSFSSRLQAKVIANGNVPLKLDPSATHERTRVIILCPRITDEIRKKIVMLDEDGNPKLDQFGRMQFLGDPRFEERLVEEFPRMLVQARADYELLCPRDGNIILPDSVIQNIEASSDDITDIIDEMIEDTFDLDPEGTIKPSDLRTEFKMALPEGVDISYDDFLSHISKKYGVVKGWRYNVSRNPVYIGIKAKKASGVV